MLLGSSGGAQIALGAATYLAAETGAPLAIVTFGGVMASDRGLEAVRALASLYGTGDGVYALGRVAFAGRWPLAVGSFWNAARREGRLAERAIGPMGHSGADGYLDPDPRPGRRRRRSMEVTVRAVAEAVRECSSCGRRSPALDERHQHRVGQRRIGARLERVDDLVPEAVRLRELVAGHRQAAGAPRRRRSGSASALSTALSLALVTSAAAPAAGAVARGLAGTA